MWRTVVVSHSIYFPNKTVPKIIKCRRSSVLDEFASTLPRFSRDPANGQPVHPPSRRRILGRSGATWNMTSTVWS